MKPKQRNKIQKAKKISKTKQPETATINKTKNKNTKTKNKIQDPKHIKTKTKHKAKEQKQIPKHSCSVWWYFAKCTLIFCSFDHILLIRP
jgi:hypothetical protein